VRVGACTPRPLRRKGASRPGGPAAHARSRPTPSQVWEMSISLPGCLEAARNSPQWRGQCMRSTLSSARGHGIEFRFRIANRRQLVARAARPHSCLCASLDEASMKLTACRSVSASVCGSLAGGSALVRVSVFLCVRVCAFGAWVCVCIFLHRWSLIMGLLLLRG